MSLREDLNEGRGKCLTSLPHSDVGGAMLLNRLKYSESGWMGTRVSIFQTAAFDALLEYERAYWIPVFSAIFQGKKTQLLHSACPEQRHRLSPGNSWER